MLSMRLLATLLFAPTLAFAGELTVTDWPLPTGDQRAAQPNLAVDGDDLVLSWIEPVDGGGHRLQFARWHDGRFGAARTAAQGRHWFVNWADFPAVQPLGDDRLAAFVLVRNGEAPYAYDVQLTTSSDAGTHWTALAPVHDDGTASEHGFVALWRWQHDLGIAWLDGRQTGGGDPDDPHAHAGAMSLRAARWQVGGDTTKTAEWPLDTRTCDCCQATAAVTDDGPVVVYRDRSEDEIRDIAIARWQHDHWTAPAIVHADRWHMPGCPVNGPAVVADHRDVHVGWFTMADGTPAVKLAHSTDAGAHFAAPITLAQGPAVLGRVTLARTADALWVSWLEENPRDPDEQSLWLRRLDPNTLAGTPAELVATTHGGRASGFPRLALGADELHVVLTDVVDGAPRVRGLRVGVATAD